MTKPEDFDLLPTEGVEGVLLPAGLLPANATADLEDEENAADYFEVNVIGTINVLEYCRKNGIKKIISTCSYSDVSGACLLYTSKALLTIRIQVLFLFRERWISPRISMRFP